MKSRIAALALVIIITLGALTFYSINKSVNSGAPLVPTSTPTSTKPPVPSTPTDKNSSAAAWGNPRETNVYQLTIISPQNMTYQSGNLTLQVNVTTGSWAINSIYYKADWLGDYHRIYSLSNQLSNQLSPRITVTANFTGIPEGNHTIEVIANYHDGSHTYGTVDFIMKT